MFIVLQRRDPNSATGFADVDLKSTGPDGRYDFAPVSPGDYLVSANHLGPSSTRPCPRIYYPKAESDSAASVIHLAASATADNIDVVLPNPSKTVTVRARVQLADGSPAVDADVNAYDINYLNSGEPNRGDSDADGRVALSVYEGRTYYLESGPGSIMMLINAEPVHVDFRTRAALIAHKHVILGTKIHEKWTAWNQLITK